ncbi:MAG: hypothetical protein JWN13_5409, partial [Betaproteobacteria bacterium]|nr:hypothetical protein [Betaproteobacteria bacterium]
TLGAALATSINGNAITTGTGTLTLGAGKTLTSSSTLTLTGTDGSTLNVGTGGTLGTAAYTAATAYAPAAGSTSITTLGTVTTGTWSATAIAPTRGGTGQSTTATSGRYLKGDGTSWGTSSGSASGTGACGANSWASTINSDAAPTCTQPSAANLSNGTTGSGAVVLATSPTLVTPVLGVAAATSVTAQSFAGTGGSNTYSVSGGGIGGTNTVALGNAAGVASIQALTSASAAAPLQINASGGSVTIGGTTVPASSTLLTTASTQIIAQSSTGGSVTGSATAYIAPGVASNALAEATRQAVIPRATVVRNLYIVTSTAQPADGVLVVTLRKNGVNTAITATIAANAAAGTFSDTTHSASFAAGDLLSLGLVNASASSSALLVGYGITVDLQ